MGGIDTHDGQELELLLSNRKPLAVFAVPVGTEETLHFRETEFGSALEQNLICKFEQNFEFEGRTVKYVAYTLPTERWRAHAYFHIKKFMYERSWCSHLEWIEGSLLGYSDSEIKTHLTRKYGNQNHNDPC